MAVNTNFPFRISVVNVNKSMITCVPQTVVLGKLSIGK